MPELVYTLCSWTNEQQDEWQRLTPEARLRRVAFRQSCLPATTPVVTIALTVEDARRRRAQVSAFTLASACVVAFLAPQPYVALARDFLEVCGPVQFPLSDNKEDPLPRNPVRVAKKGKALETWRVNGLSEVVQFFENAFLSEDLHSAGDILHCLTAAARTAQLANQAYARLGEPSSLPMDSDSPLPDQHVTAQPIPQTAQPSELEPMPFFDYKTMDPSLYDHLNSSTSRAKFIMMVVCYFEYLRSNPEDLPTWNNKIALEYAQVFLHMVNNDVAWPLVHHAVGEFRSVG